MTATLRSVQKWVVSCIDCQWYPVAYWSKASAQRALRTHNQRHHAGEVSA